MRLGAMAGACAALVLLGSAPPQDARPEKLRELSKGSLTYRSYPQPRAVEWETALRKALATQTPNAAADALAPNFGLKQETMRELVRLWIAVQVGRYNLDDKPARSQALRTGLGALAASSRDPLVLQIAAESLDAIEDCGKDNFDALMVGSKDTAADAWLIANAAPCADNFAHYLKVAPDRPVPVLIRQMSWGSLKSRDSLPVAAWLASPTGLAHIAETDRARAAAILTRDYAVELFETGLTGRAVALLDGLTPELRAAALSDADMSMTARIDGFPVTFGDRQPATSLSTYLAAAYAISGRKAEADALFAKNPDLGAAKQALTCAGKPDAEDKDPKCRRGGRDPDMKVLILDHYLNRPADDPYPLAETLFGAASFSNSPQGALAEVTCRVFAEPQYAEPCGDARKATLAEAHDQPSDYERPGSDLTLASIDALALPGLAEIRTDLHAALDATGPAPATTRSSNRASIDPDPSPFAEQPLPAAYRGERPKPPVWPKSVARLPDGYSPVRLEIAGQRVTAISISGNVDPTGEISGGGYWAHLSEDGGKTWQPPLYTGLAQLFPYLVPESSRMPLRDGDVLNLEVEVSLIDTASITYPPVGLRTRRKASGLYLRMPLADLKRDTDGDGITDITARHLLLDRARTDGGTPFIVGTDPAGSCRAAPSPERLALQGILLKIFELPSAAIVEPVDRKPGAFALGWSKVDLAAGRPVLVKGDPRDFACLKPDRLMVVYGDKDVEALQRHTPDFRTVELPRIVYNRARNRGYVIWSAGWVGGTYRLRLVNGKWKFDAISSWIS